MKQDISFDVGCGTYSVFMQLPGQPPSSGGDKKDKLTCWAANKFPNHGHIREDVQSQYAAKICSIYGVGEITRSTGGGYYSVWYNDRGSLADYSYGIAWDAGLDGCFPEGLTAVRQTTERCTQMLTKAFKACEFLPRYLMSRQAVLLTGPSPGDNGGWGGRYEIGCVVSTFQPQRLLS